MLISGQLSKLDTDANMNESASICRRIFILLSPTAGCCSRALRMTSNWRSILKINCSERRGFLRHSLCQWCRLKWKSRSTALQTSSWSGIAGPARSFSTLFKRDCWDRRLIVPVIICRCSSIFLGGSTETLVHLKKTGAISFLASRRWGPSSFLRSFSLP